MPASNKTQTTTTKTATKPRQKKAPAVKGIFITSEQLEVFLDAQRQSFAAAVAESQIRLNATIEQTHHSLSREMVRLATTVKTLEDKITSLTINPGFVAQQQFAQCHGFGNLSSTYPSGTFPTAGNGLNRSTHQFKDLVISPIFKPRYQSTNPTFTLAGLILAIESTKNGRQMLNFDMSFKFLHIGALAIVFKKAVPGTFSPAVVIGKIYDAYRNLAMSAPITLEENYLVYLEDSETGQYVPIQSVDSFEAWIKVKSNTQSDVNNNKQTLIDSISYFTPFSLMGIITELKNGKMPFGGVLNFDFKFERVYMGNTSNTAIVLVYGKRDEGELSHKGLGEKLEAKLQEQVELLSLSITDVTEKPFFATPCNEGPLSMIQNAVGLVNWLDGVKKD